jgi:hypothetical protein
VSSRLAVVLVGKYPIDGGTTNTSERSLARRRRELFVVDHIDHQAGKLRGVLDGRRRTFTMSAMGPDLRRITMQENDHGLEPLAVFIGHGGQMLKTIGPC